MVDLATRANAIITQYNESPNLHQLYLEIADILQVEVINPLLVMDRAINPDIARGVVLEWLGTRLGLPRPFIRDTDRPFLGFENTGASEPDRDPIKRGFDQAPFYSRLAGLESVIPIGDNSYIPLLKARARRLRGGANRETIEEILHIIFGNGYLLESGNIIEAPGPPRNLEANIRTLVIDSIAIDMSWNRPLSHSVTGYRIVINGEEKEANYGRTTYTHRLESINPDAVQVIEVYGLNEAGLGKVARKVIAIPPATVPEVVPSTLDAEFTLDGESIGIDTFVPFVNNSGAYIRLNPITTQEGESHTFGIVLDQSVYSSISWTATGFPTALGTRPESGNTTWNFTIPTTGRAICYSLVVTVGREETFGSMFTVLVERFEITVPIVVHTPAENTDRTLQLYVDTNNTVLLNTVRNNLHFLLPIPAGMPVDINRRDVERVTDND